MNYFKDGYSARLTPAQEEALFPMTRVTPAQEEALFSARITPAQEEYMLGEAPAAETGWGAKAQGFLGNVGMGLMVAQALSGIYGAYVGSKALKATQKGQAQIARNNAESMQMAVEMSRRQGEAIIGKITRQAGQTKATQRARAAANGIAIGVGNTAEVMATTDLLKQEDMRTAELNAIAQSFGYQGQRASYLGRGAALDIMGNANGAGAVGNAVVAGLEGAGRVANYWTAWKGGF